MGSIEAELKTLMIAGLAGNSPAHQVLLDRLGGHLRAYFKGRLTRVSVEVLPRRRIFCIGLPHCSGF
jgi:hypothetical protein